MTNIVRCPCCEHLFDADNHPALALSPVAFAILTTAPERFRRGSPVSVVALAAAANYSPSHTRRGLNELVMRGYVARVPYGRRLRQYAGVPSMMLSEAVRSMAA
jgi:DNA-binding IclR family transcriptional regulator